MIDAMDVAKSKQKQAPTMIALTGKARSGKDTVAGFMKKHNEWCWGTALAGPLKSFCRDTFDFSSEQLHGKLKGEVDPRWGITPRHALQTLGTEWGRQLHEDVWVLGLIRRAEYTRGIYKQMIPVVTDVRFLNECRILREHGAEIWRVTRPGEGTGDVFADSHPSEIEQNAIIPDVEVDNAGGDLASLEALVVGLMKTRGLL